MTTSVDAVRRLHAAGVRLMAGSDSAWGRSRAGGGWLEIDALTDAGLSPAEAIVAGTADSAAAIGVADVAGRLEPGRPADVLVVAGDPLADLAVLGDPLDVFLAGRRDRPQPRGSGPMTDCQPPVNGAMASAARSRSASVL